MPSSHSIARGLREVLVGEDPLQIDRLWQRCSTRATTTGAAAPRSTSISAIDIALWDIAGKAAGRPGLRAARRPPHRRRSASTRARSCRRRPTRCAGSPERAVEAGYTAPSSSAGGRSVATSRTTRQLVRAAREDARPGARSDARRRPRLHGQACARAAAPRRGARASTGSRRRCSPTISTDTDASPTGAAVRIAAGEADETFGAVSRARRARPRSTSCSRISRAAAGSPSPGRSRCSSGHRPSRSSPTASRRGVLVAASLHFVATLDRPTWSEYSVADSPLVNGILREPFALRGRLARRSRRPGARRRAGRRRDGPLPSGSCRWPAIEFRGVTKRFADGTVAVDDLDLEIDGRRVHDLRRPVRVAARRRRCGWSPASSSLPPARSSSATRSSTTSTRSTATSRWCSRTTRSTRT